MPSLAVHANGILRASADDGSRWPGRASRLPSGARRAVGRVQRQAVEVGDAVRVDRERVQFAVGGQPCQVFQVALDIGHQQQVAVGIGAQQGVAAQQVGATEHQLRMSGRIDAVDAQRVAIDLFHPCEATVGIECDRGDLCGVFTQHLAMPLQIAAQQAPAFRAIAARAIMFQQQHCGWLRRVDGEQLAFGCATEGGHDARAALAGRCQREQLPRRLQQQPAAVVRPRQRGRVGLAEQPLRFGTDGRRHRPHAAQCALPLEPGDVHAVG
jgi:hypothetical protein